MAVEVESQVGHVGQVFERLVVVAEGEGLEVIFVDLDWTRLLLELLVVGLCIVRLEALVARVLLRGVERLLLRDVLRRALLALLWVRESSRCPLLASALMRALRILGRI